MKRIHLICLAMALCILCPMAFAETAAEAPAVIRIADESELPEGWQEKDLLRVTVMDLQRSDSILLQCGGENMLIDGGLGLFYKRLFAVLDRQGVTELKYLWSSHCDGDHSQGLKCLMNSDLYKGGELLCMNPKTYNDPDKDHQKMVTAADRHGWPYVRIYNGDTFTVGGATVTMLQCEENWGQNNRSATCFVDFGDRSLFLTADVGSRVQNYFVENVDPERLDCDIMKAPHHGIDGVTQAFVDAVDPELIFLTNYSNNGAHKSWNAYDPYMTGDGVLHMETDGTVWYTWQEPNFIDPD